MQMHVRLTPEHTSLCMEFLRDTLCPLVAEVTAAAQAIQPESEDFSLEITKVCGDNLPDDSPQLIG
jgi:hypothetical protein